MDFNKKISIIIPCYNEENNIITIVNKVLESSMQNKEIIVVDDCSTDNTRLILKEKIRPLVSKIIYHEQNLGKGAALRAGFQAASGDAVIIQDADLEYDPQDYAKVVEPIFSGVAKVCYGSRFLKQKRKGYFLNRIANFILTVCSNYFTHQKITDMETCYKAFARDLIQSMDLKENRFGFEPEVTGKVSKKGIKIHEVPINYYPRKSAEGKKIGFKDGVRALYVIWKYR